MESFVFIIYIFLLESYYCFVFRVRGEVFVFLVLVLRLFEFIVVRVIVEGFRRSFVLL